MKNKEKYLTLEQVKQINTLNKMKYEVKKSIPNIIIGSVCVVVGSLTLPLPTGSVFLIGLGLLILSSPLKIRVLLNHTYQDIKDKITRKKYLRSITR